MKAVHDKQKGFGIQYDGMYLVHGARTAFGKLGGTLAQVSPTDLAIFASKAAMEKSGIRPDEVDQVIMANIGQSSYDAYFLPRHIGLYAGVPQGVPAVMVQRICGSGFETITARLAKDYASFTEVAEKHGIEISAKRLRRVVHKVREEEPTEESMWRRLFDQTTSTLLRQSS